jgi:hypothetical protein
MDSLDAFARRLVRIGAQPEIERLGCRQQLDRHDALDVRQNAAGSPAAVWRWRWSS